MSSAKLELLYEEREDAIARLLHAWLETRSVYEDCEAHEELDNASIALMGIQQGLLAERYTIKRNRRRAANGRGNPHKT